MFDVILIKENVAYKVSYKLVGFLISKTGFYKVIYKYGGSTTLKTIMSYTHWESRGEISNIPNKLYNNLANLSNKRISTVNEIIGCIG